MCERSARREKVIYRGRKMRGKKNQDIRVRAIFTNSPLWCICSVTFLTSETFGQRGTTPGALHTPMSDTHQEIITAFGRIAKNKER